MRKSKALHPSERKFIVVKFLSKKIEDAYRAVDGMLVAQRQNNTVIVGEDTLSLAKRHQFINELWAEKFLREICCEGDFEEREGESAIISGVELPLSRLALDPTRTRNN
jgi:hypothetical protein